MSAPAVPPEHVPGHRATGAGAALTVREVHQALRGAVYPARPRDLAERARGNAARPVLVAALLALPDQPVCGPNQVCAALLGPHVKDHSGP